MIVASQPDDLGLSLGPIEAARIGLICLVATWLQIFVVETNTIGFGFGPFKLAGPASMIIDLPVVVIVALTVRQADVAPWFGFALGLLVDSYQPTMFGFHAGLFCLAGSAGPSLVSAAPGVGTLTTGAASIGAALLAVRTALIAVLTGGLRYSLAGTAVSLAGSTLVVVALTFPLAGVLDRRSRPLRYMNRSIDRGGPSSRRRMSSIFQWLSRR